VLLLFYHQKRRGLSRFKEHLGHIPGSVEACRKVPNHVKDLMSQKVMDGRIRRARGKKLRLFVEKEVSATRHGYQSARIPLDEEAHIDMAMRNSLRDSFPHWNMIVVHLLISQLVCKWSCKLFYREAK
jgi:hypothetical protein